MTHPPTQPEPSVEAWMREARMVLDDTYSAGTRVINCIIHNGPITQRPHSCELCFTDLRNHMSHAIDVNAWLNRRVEALAALLKTALEHAPAAAVQAEPDAVATDRDKDGRPLPYRYCDLCGAVLCKSEATTCVPCASRMQPQPDTASLTALRQLREDFTELVGRRVESSWIKQHLRSLNEVIARLESRPLADDAATRLHGDAEAVGRRPYQILTGGGSVKLTVKRGPREVVLDLSRPDVCETLIAGLLDELNINDSLDRAASARPHEAEKDQK